MGAGKVYIVGAGPGSADLITVRGLRAARLADVLICDDLLPRSFLADVGVPAEGKEIQWLGSDGRRPGQSEINRRIYEAARDGKVVVRLKGGDPFVFGRGNEEVEFLSNHGVPWEVIPGVSASMAAPAVAGLPLTWRQRSRSFAVVSARCAGGTINDAMPRADSLVVLMGVAVIEEVADQLVHDGWPPDTPAAVIERATMPWERRAYGVLAEIADVARKAGVASPAVFVVGEAASRRAAFQMRPRVLFTGLDPANFRALGDLIHWPALQVEPDRAGYAALPGVLGGLARADFDHVVFTSKMGVRSFLDALEDYASDARLLAGATLVAAGAGTAMRLQEHGLLADVVPLDGGSEGILASLAQVPGSRVLLVQGSHAPRGLERGIRSAGGEVTRLALHRVVPHPDLGRSLPEHDVIYFVSPSGVRSYAATYGEAAFQREAWCIGDVTLAELTKHGFNGKVVQPHVSASKNAAVAAH
ncbi:MAG: uroporphyrinogen-III C-methyltransferase [Planctomycetota bacterium]|jgi:uroporphyrinogen III methyltransferase/synthase